jgi:uncharacterized protein YcbX
MANAVARISTTPVKGLCLAHPAEVELTRTGARDDRRFYLVTGDGRLCNAKLAGRLVTVTARWDAEARVLSLTFPDGTVVEDDVRHGEAIRTSFYGSRTVSGRQVVGPFAETLSAHTGVDMLLVERDAGEIATDSAPATLVSSASLARLAADGRRFRMLLELDGPTAHEEDTWAGRHAHVGGALLLVGGPTGRCAVTTHDPDTGVRDRDVLAEIAAYRGIPADGPAAGEICFGVYAAVLEPGVVRVGDAFAVL